MRWCLSLCLVFTPLVIIVEVRTFIFFLSHVRIWFCIALFYEIRLCHGRIILLHRKPSVWISTIPRYEVLPQYLIEVFPVVVHVMEIFFSSQYSIDISSKTWVISSVYGSFQYVWRHFIRAGWRSVTSFALKFMLRLMISMILGIGVNFVIAHGGILKEKVLEDCPWVQIQSVLPRMEIRCAIPYLLIQRRIISNHIIVALTLFELLHPFPFSLIFLPEQTLLFVFLFHLQQLPIIIVSLDCIVQNLICFSDFCKPRSGFLSGHIMPRSFIGMIKLCLFSVCFLDLNICNSCTIVCAFFAIVELSRFGTPVGVG
mmetsp:Transcript_43788/g.93102  ORF Transcript_43788/g.93102 Transcript_43788/m.93102 type:complete len:314 (-) Transcript_43788:321-1262(-)